MEENIYKSPDADLIDQQPSERSSETGNYKLFKVSGIGLATVVAGLPAGGFLLAKNFNRLGNFDLAKKAFGLSILAFFLVLGLGFLLPEGIPSIVFTVVQVLGIMQVTKYYQEDVISKHSQHEKLESNWKAFGISLLVFLVEILVLGGIGAGIYMVAPEATMNFLES